VDVLTRHSRRALYAALLFVASASCEWITPLDFVGNGVDAQALPPEAGGSDAEASSVNGAADGALKTGGGSADGGMAFDQYSCDPVRLGSNPLSCGVCDHSCLGGIGCGCHPVAFPEDANPANVVAADAKADSAGSSDDSSAPPPPTNLIRNGNFAQGTTDWAIRSGTATAAIVAGDLCVAVTGANDTTTIVLGWPEPPGSAGAALSATGFYAFSYTAHATEADVTINAIVGDSVGPNYLPVDFESKPELVTTTATTFTYPFTPAHGADASAGISFSFVSKVAQSVCFANVSLVEN
jgi:hypothetical protein